MRSVVLTAVLVGAAALAWLYFAPTRIGGSTTYVVTHGISMEPRFHTGDLAIVRPTDDYRIGQVVAYHSTLLHTVVLHRIIAISGSRYVFKGDHNTFIDPTRPTRALLVGALWLHVPHGGIVMGWLHTPAIAAALSGLAALLLVMDTGRRRRRRDRRRTMPNAASRQRVASVNGSDSSGLRSVSLPSPLIASGVAALVFLALGMIAFARPAWKATTASALYTQHMSFGYSASAPAGPAYPNGVVSTGAPIFLQLVRRLDVRIRYHFDTDSPHQLAGTEGVILRVVGPTGWSRDVQLMPPRPFTGTATSTQVTLDLSALQSLLRGLQSETGVPAALGSTYQIVPKVHLHGTVSGQPVDSSFAPTLDFEVQSLQLQPSDSLNPSQRGTVPTAATAANTLGVAGHDASVSTIRGIALIGFLLAAASTALLSLSLMRRRPFDENAQIHARYGHMIVPIAGTSEDLSWAPFDVPNFKALARLAENSERLILHYRETGGDTYLVNDEGTIYRYRTKPNSVVWGEWSSVAPKPLVGAPDPTADISAA